MLKDRLISLRKQHKKTQEDMAKVLGITRPAYTAYERGTRNPDYETLIKIADFFDVSTDYLLRGEGYRQQAKDLLNDPDTQVAARDGGMDEEQALEALEWLLKKERGRKPGDKQKEKD